MRIALTGATGKIGRLITRTLLDRGHKISAMIRPTRQGHWGDTTLAVEELRGWGAELFEADFADDDSLKAFAQDADVLLHNGYHHVNEDHHPVEWTNLNILATIKLYEAFWKAGGEQIIFISSGAVYGKGPAQELEKYPGSEMAIDERTPRAPQGLYAVYKSCIEDATVVFKTVHGLKHSTTLRPGSEGFPELLGFRAYDERGFFAEETRKLLAGQKVSIQLPPQIACVDGVDLGLAVELLTQRAANDEAIADWYIANNSAIPREQFQQIHAEIFGATPLTITPIAQPRPLSDALLRSQGYSPRGSATTLRNHFQELAQKIGSLRH